MNIKKKKKSKARICLYEKQITYIAGAGRINMLRK